MAGERFSWRNPTFTYADALTGARLVMLPYLIYGLAVRLAGLALATLLVMIATDLIDGRIARRLGQSRTFGAAFDSGIDFLVIYSLFTTFFAIGILPWWKWIVIFAPAILMAVTQILYLVRAPEVSFAVAPAGKLVGQIQFVYLPVLLLRTFWLTAPWGVIADHVIFAILAAASAVNALDYARLLAGVLRRPAPAGPR
jgi:phosphatidylglycerophosphate synthase